MQYSNAESIRYLHDAINERLEKYGGLPKRIVVYRDGLGESQLAEIECRGFFYYSGVRENLFYEYW